MGGHVLTEDLKIDRTEEHEEIERLTREFMKKGKVTQGPALCKTVSEVQRCESNLNKTISWT